MLYLRISRVASIYLTRHIYSFHKRRNIDLADSFA